MRRILSLAGILIAASASQTRALNPLVADREALSEHELGGDPAAAHGDTVWFGGSGTGDGSVARGGTWTWEADSGEPPELFPDGDPIGNQYRDGWTFEDRSARRGPSQSGAGHWRADGTYDFDFDGGAFAHRATTHANDGVNDGPDPLAEPGIGGSWSVWIGTNLHLNPEDCAWSQTAGYGDGWLQEIQTKTYAIPQGTPAGTQYAIRFFHRYAVEDGFDTCWVETSLDGIYWDQVGTQTAPNGIYNGGDRTHPKPGAGGAAEVVNLLTWPGNPGGAAELHVRFRLLSDFFSDNNEGGSFLWAWQLDNIRFLRNGVPQDDATFESGMDGWEPASFEGFDFQLTGDPDRPAGRIVPITALACPPVVDCPEACGLENRILIFVDKDDCDQNDAFAESYATSPAWAIGGPANPDIDGDAGRLLRSGGRTRPRFCVHDIL